MKYIHNLIFLIIFVLTLSCEKEISWKTSQMPVMLVVEGSFTNENIKHQVKLSLSADYFYNKPTPRVSGAELTISDGVNVVELAENPVGSGTYETVTPVAGVPGKTYTLDINLKEPVNNTTHYHASGKMFPGIHIDSLMAFLYDNPFYMEGSRGDSLLLIAVSIGQEPLGINNFYQLNLYKNGVLLNDTIDEVQVTDDKQGMEGELVNSFLFFEQFNEGDTVQLEIISVEKEYYEFVNTIQQLAGQSVDPFNMTGPPANSVGNIEGAEAIGFFKVGYVSKGSAVARYFKEKK